MSWAGHELQWKQVGLEKPKERRWPGKPKHRCWDQVTSDTTYPRTSVEMAEGRQRWKVLVGVPKSQMGHKWYWFIEAQLTLQILYIDYYILHQIKYLLKINIKFFIPQYKILFLIVIAYLSGRDVFSSHKVLFKTVLSRPTFLWLLFYYLFSCLRFKDYTNIN